MTQVAGPFLAIALAFAVLPASALGQVSPAPAAAQTAPAATSAPAAPAPAATPTALPDNDQVDKRAKAEFLAWQSGKLDRSNYSDQLRDAASDFVVTQLSPQLQVLGDFKSIQFTSAWLDRGYANYQYIITCSKGVMLMLYALDPKGKVGGVRFAPPPPPPTTP